MALQLFLCSEPQPPYTCSYLSFSRENVVNHLLANHIGIPLFRRRYGAAALTQLPISATLLHQPDADALNAALPIFHCDGCEVYFVHARAYIEHLLTDVAHAQDSAASIDELGAFNFEDFMLAEHIRFLVLGAPPPEAAAGLRRRVMVNFTRPYTHAATSVDLNATTSTIAELADILQSAYRDEDPIDWATIWQEGLVLRYSTKAGGTGRISVTNDVDVVELVGNMDFGECCIGDERWH